MRGRPVSGGSRRAWRWAGLATLSVVSALGGTFLLLPAFVRGLVQVFGWLLRGSVWLATSAARGDDAWTIAAAVGQGVATALLTPGALGLVGGLLVLGAAAVFGLQRMLDSEDESVATTKNEEESVR